MSVLLLLAAGAALAPAAASMVASPPSTLLAPGVTMLPLQLVTSQAASCRWDSANVSFTSMTHSFSSAGNNTHTTILVGLSGGLAVSVVYVQCDAFSAGPPLILAYRSLPDSGNAPFPRLGNLWGSKNFRGHPQGLRYAASRSSLWAGAYWSAAELAQLRAANTYTVALTSMNACETTALDLPDSFYLLNITQPPSTKGRLQSWPGAWRLDLTNPAVQAYQAQLMYCLVVYGGTGYGTNPGCNYAAVLPMVWDGLFVDNVFVSSGAAVNAFDIFHNPFVPVDRATGQPMVNFDEKWKLGMIAMLTQFREMMPSGLLQGHAMDSNNGNISALFNGISIGFTTPQIVEGRLPFSRGLKQYTDWLTLPAPSPKVTMVESAVRLQLSCGYGFGSDVQTLISPSCYNSNLMPGAPVPGIGAACQPTQPQPPGYLPPQTYLLARSEYQYFRFGLAFTLMGDGYFTHEFGDSTHGQDWDYDELHFNLGAALGNATAAIVLNPPPVLPPIPLTQSWALYVRYPNTSNALRTVSATVVPFAGAPSSARVDIQNTSPSRTDIDLSQVVNGFRGGAYQLSFWAKASRDATPVQLNARKDGGDWHNFGLDVPIVLSAQWAQYNITFQSAGDGTAGRLSWFLGAAAANTSVWVNSPTLVGAVAASAVLIRDFECGVVVLNGATQNSTVQLPPGLQRLVGQQAPLWQYFVDDGSSAFQAVAGNWSVANYNNGYNGVTAPALEEVRPANGYFHHWQAGVHRAPAGSSATFLLQVPAAGAYDVSLWWPAAVPARWGWAQAMRVTISPGDTQVFLNLSSQGGDMFFPIANAVQLEAASVLTVECPPGGGDCIADAVLIESAARWNDGSPAAVVTLQAMDAIVLQKVAGVPSNCAAVAPSATVTASATGTATATASGMATGTASGTGTPSAVASASMAPVQAASGAPSASPVAAPSSSLSPAAAVPSPSLAVAPSPSPATAGSGASSIADGSGLVQVGVAADSTTTAAGPTAAAPQQVAIAVGVGLAVAVTLAGSLLIAWHWVSRRPRPLRAARATAAGFAAGRSAPTANPLQVATHPPRPGVSPVVDADARRLACSNPIPLPSHKAAYAPERASSIDAEW